MLQDCTKPSKKTYFIPEYQKEWMWLDTGSFFIFCDSFKNIDSVYVKNVNVNFFTFNNFPNEQQYNCTMSNNIIYNSRALLPYLELEMAGKSDCVPLILYDRKPTKQQIYSTNPDLSLSYLDTILPKYKLGNLNLDSTYVWHVHHDDIAMSDSTTYYFTKGVGITRMINHQRKTDKWLVRYKIIEKK
jgi:hypothetical protein